MYCLLNKLNLVMTEKPDWSWFNLFLFSPIYRNPEWSLPLQIARALDFALVLLLLLPLLLLVLFLLQLFLRWHSHLRSSHVRTWHKAVYPTPAAVNRTQCATAASSTLSASAGGRTDGMRTRQIQDELLSHSAQEFEELASKPGAGLRRSST